MSVSSVSSSTHIAQLAKTQVKPSTDKDGDKDNGNSKTAPSPSQPQQPQLAPTGQIGSLVNVKA